MTASSRGGVTPSLSADDLVKAVPQLGDVADIRAETVSKVASANLDFETVRNLVERANDSDADAIVVTQGTDTLEETSFLCQLIYSGTKPIIFTGAMRSPKELSSDGPANLYAAVLTAIAARSGDVFVVMDNIIHFPERVIKASTSELSAFQSPQGYSGYISEGKVHWINRRYSDELNGALEGAQQAHAIALLKLVSVDDAALLDAVDDGPYKGLVIEAYGAGHIAEGLTEKVKALVRKMPVILCSQSAAGPMMERTYGYVGAELDLLNAGLLPGKHLNSKKTRLLLSLLLGAESGDVRADFVRLASLC